ncbi:hypothetical protein [Vibrio ulleungensis]|uniref:Phosphoenolpyruvate synthase n=1 Tax=Vibrio ulleungensis TaxID=2807619 RepID=A0ABS2HDV3_9VIBR|nr:hypothetical protein [Vibrio ulleungensis]MBM7035773.1 hypothetical protein [Vibrio ulleungensis]
MSNQQSWCKPIVQPESNESVGNWIDIPTLLNEQSSDLATQIEKITTQMASLSQEEPLYLVFPKAEPHAEPLWDACCTIAASLKTTGYVLNVVVPHVRLMSEAASAIDALAAHGLPRGIPGLKVLMSISCAASALALNKLISYVDGVVVDVEELGMSTFATAQLDSPMQSSAVLEQLVYDCILSASEAGKPCFIGPYGLVTPSLKERVTDKKLRISGVINTLK